MSDGLVGGPETQVLQSHRGFFGENAGCVIWIMREKTTLTRDHEVWRNRAQLGSFTDH